MENTGFKFFGKAQVFHRCRLQLLWDRCNTFSLCMNNPQKAESHGATEMAYFIMS